MNRSPLKRSKPLSRGTAVLARGKPVNARSKKRRAEYAGPTGRAAFVAAYLAEHPTCQRQGPHCTQIAEHVHESILRSRGGAIVPGSMTDAQGQRFYAVCANDHAWIHDHRPESERLGFLDPRNATQIAEASA